MTIIFLANFRLPTEKAHGFQISKMCEEFARQGARVELYYPFRRNSLAEDVFSYYHLERNFKTKKLGVPDFILFKRFLGPSVFWLQSLAFLVRLLFLRFPPESIIYTRQPEVIWLFKKRGYKTVFDAHFWPSSKEGLFRWLLSKTDFVVTNSQGTAQAFREKGFKSILAVPNGVDLSEFNRIIEDKATLRDQLNLPKEKPLIMYLGHLYKWKGVEVVIEAAIGAQAWNFVLVGGRSEEVERYQRLKEEKGWRNIEFLGQVRKEKVPAYLKAADCLLLPNVPVSKESEFYTSPIKMFEYMASGVPIVASDLPSLREVLNDANAFWFEAGKAEKMRRAIGEVLENTDKSKQVSNQAFQDVKNYTWFGRANKILTFLSQAK